MCCCQVSWYVVACFRCRCWAEQTSLQSSRGWWRLQNWGPPPRSLLPTSPLLSLQSFCISSCLPSRDRCDVPQLLSWPGWCKLVLSGAKAAPPGAQAVGAFVARGPVDSEESLPPPCLASPGDEKQGPPPSLRALFLFWFSCLPQPSPSQPSSAVFPAARCCEWVQKHPLQLGKPQQLQTPRVCLWASAVGWAWASQSQKMRWGLLWVGPFLSVLGSTGRKILSLNLAGKSKPAYGCKQPFCILSKVAFAICTCPV